MPGRFKCSILLVTYACNSYRLASGFIVYGARYRIQCTAGRRQAGSVYHSDVYCGEARYY